MNDIKQIINQKKNKNKAIKQRCIYVQTCSLKRLGKVRFENQAIYRKILFSSLQILKFICGGTYLCGNQKWADLEMLKLSALTLFIMRVIPL